MSQGFSWNAPLDVAIGFDPVQRLVLLDIGRGRDRTAVKLSSGDAELLHRLLGQAIAELAQPASQSPPEPA